MMAQGNSSNANRYKGEDIDDDGDGQVDKADDTAAIDGLPVDSSSVSSGQFLTYDGSNVVSQGVDTTSIDNDSITENSNGDITVNKPSEDVYGDFEADKGFSSEQRIDSMDDGADISNLKYFSGDYAISPAGSTIDGKNTIGTLTVDVSNYSTLKFAVYSSWSDPDVFIYIDGTQEKTLTFSEATPTVIEFNLSNYTGSKDIDIAFGSYTTSSTPYYAVDNIRLVKNPRRVVQAEAGN